MSLWLEHVKKTMKGNPGKPLKDVLKIAKASYKRGEKLVSDLGKTAIKAVSPKQKRTRAKKGTKKGSRKSRRGSRKSRRGSRKSRRGSRKSRR